MNFKTTILSAVILFSVLSTKGMCPFFEDSAETVQPKRPETQAEAYNRAINQIVSSWEEGWAAQRACEQAKKDHENQQLSSVWHALN